MGRIFKRNPISAWLERIALRTYRRTVEHELRRSLRRMDGRLTQQMTHQMAQQTRRLELVLEARMEARYADMRDLLFGDRLLVDSPPHDAPAQAMPCDAGSDIAGRTECTRHFLDHFEVANVLDVGCGLGTSFGLFAERGVPVTGIDILPEELMTPRLDGRTMTYIRGDFMEFDTAERYDAVYSSHVVEHMPDTQAFLRKKFSLLTPGGAFCVIWPRPKSTIVGGHVHCFNMGLMLYNLVSMGVNCREAIMVASGYSLAVMGRYKTFELPPLAHDNGDIERLADYFPCKAHQDFDGDRISGIQRLAVAEPATEGQGS